MPERRLSRRKLTKFSIGNMRDRVSLERRVTISAAFGDPEPTEQHTVIAEVWAQVDTPRMGNLGVGDRVYNGVNIQESSSYTFTIRYRDDITSHDTIIKWQGDIFKITKTGIISPQRRNQYLVISAVLAGDAEKEANQ